MIPRRNFRWTFKEMFDENSMKLTEDLTQEFLEKFKENNFEALPGEFTYFLPSFGRIPRGTSVVPLDGTLGRNIR